MAQQISTVLLITQDVPVIYLEMVQAFDKVPHNSLITKIRFYLPKDLMHTLTSFLETHIFTVNVGKSRSSKRRIEAEVPQGSVHSPLLFSLYFNDIPHIPQIRLFPYADDIAVLARRINLEHKFKILQQRDLTKKWPGENHLTFSAQKSQTNCYTCCKHKYPKRFTSPKQSTLQTQKLKWAPKATCLGVNFGRRMRLHLHVRRIQTSAKSSSITTSFERTYTPLGTSPGTLQKVLPTCSLRRCDVVDYSIEVQGYTWASSETHSALRFGNVCKFSGKNLMSSPSLNAWESYLLTKPMKPFKSQPLSQRSTGDA